MLAKIIQPSYEAYFLWLELTLSFVIPITMLSFKRVRLSPKGLYLASLSAILGFVTNRLNISITGFETWAGRHFVPKWTELMITVSIIAMGFFVFGLAVKYLPIYEHASESEPIEESRIIRREVPKASHVAP
jgi:Ni/Fe-hydrogenase subunit HybB-like protein